MSAIESLSDFAKRKRGVLSDPAVRVHLEKLTDHSLGIGITPERGKDEDLSFARRVSEQIADAIDFDLRKLRTRLGMVISAVPAARCTHSVAVINGTSTGRPAIFASITFPDHFPVDNALVLDYVNGCVRDVLEYLKISRKSTGAPIRFCPFTVINTRCRT